MVLASRGRRVASVFGDIRMAFLKREAMAIAVAATKWKTFVFSFLCVMFALPLPKEK